MYVAAKHNHTKRPGNVRELRNLMERLAYLFSGDRIEAEDLAFIDTNGTSDSISLDLSGSLTAATNSIPTRVYTPEIDTTQGNMSQAAKRIGLHRSDLYRKMRQLDMSGAEAEQESTSPATVSMDHRLAELVTI